MTSYRKIYVWRWKKVNNIIYSKGKDLSQFFNYELFIQKDFDKLNQIVKDLKLDNTGSKGKEKSQQARLGSNPTISIPKLNIKKDGKVKIFTYYDLNISSTDLMV